MVQDGFPRNVPQAEEFQKVGNPHSGRERVVYSLTRPHSSASSFQVTSLDLVVNIDLPQWILAEKISGRRCVCPAMRLCPKVETETAPDRQLLLSL